MINFPGNVLRCPQQQFLKKRFLHEIAGICITLCSSPWTTYVFSFCLYIYKQNERTYIVQGEEQRERYISQLFRVRNVFLKTFAGDIGVRLREN
jgi:hypothetical protein